MSGPIYTNGQTPLPAQRADLFPPGLDGSRFWDATAQNAVAAAVQELLTHSQGWVNVKSYGAKGDGVTDDTAAIQALITAIGSNLATVIVPGPTRITSAVVFPPTARVRFESGGAFVGAGTATFIPWTSDVAASAGGTVTVSLPAPFPDPGVRFFRDDSGNYSTSFDPVAYVASWGVTSTLYVDAKNGNDSTGAGTAAAPYKTVAKAMAVAIASGDAAIQITVVTNSADVVFGRDEFTSASGDTKQISAKRIAIVPDNPAFHIYVSTQQRGLSWALTAGQTKTYETTRSGVTGVLDMGWRDASGIPRQYALKTSIAEVEATAGSWYQSGSTVYVHTLYGNAPVEDRILIGVSLLQSWVQLDTSAELFMRNCYLVGPTPGVAQYVFNKTSDYTANRFVTWDCAWANANPLYSSAQGSNGLAVEAIKTVQHYYPIAAYNTADGLNFHYTRADPGAAAVRNYYALVFAPVAYDNGLGNAVAPNINNGITSHDGAHIAVIAGSTWNNQGPNVAMVNGCNTVLIGVRSKLSAATTTDQQHAAYYFDQQSLPAGVTGQVYMDDCEGADTVWDLWTDATALPVTIRDFVGSKIRAPSTPITYLANSGRARASLAAARPTQMYLPPVVSSIPGRLTLQGADTNLTVRAGVSQTLPLTKWTDSTGVTTYGSVTSGGDLDFSPGNYVKAWRLMSGGKQIVFSTAAPSGATYTYAVGDIVFNSAPSVGQPKGWVCTVAGAPGTWVSMGNL